MARWVNVVGPDGSAKAVPDWAVADLPQGWRPETNPERKERKAREEVEGPLGQIGAALAGAGRGATLGFSDVALAHTGTVAPDTLDALKLEHPGTSMAGELTGAVGGMLLHKKLPNPAGLAAKVGSSIEAKTALDIAGKFGTGLAGRMAQQFIPKAAGAMAEGGLYGAGMLISENALGNEELTADNLIAYAGMGAILSGGAAGVLGAGGELARSSLLGAGRGMSKAVERVWEGSTGSEAAKGLGHGWAKLSGALSNAPDDAIEALMAKPFSKEGHAIRQAAMAGRDVRAKAAGELAEVANNVKRVASKVQLEAMGEMKIDSVRKLVQQGNEADVARQMNEMLGELYAQVHRHAGFKKAGIKADSARYGKLGKSYGNDARKWLHELQRTMRRAYKVTDGPPPASTVVDELQGTAIEKSIRWKGKQGTAAGRPAAMVDDASKAVDGTAASQARIVGSSPNANADVYAALDGFKRKIGAFKKLKRWANAQDEATVNAYRDMYERVRLVLEDETLWGQMGRAQREVNEAWANHLRNANLFRNRFMTEVDQTAEASDWLRRYDVDPAKVERFLKDIADPRGDIPASILRNNVSTERRLVEMIEKHYDVTDLAEDIGVMKANSKKLAALIDDVEGKITLGNQLRALDEAAVQGRDLMGAGLGYAMGGVPGAAIMGGAVDMAARPGKAVRTLFAIESLVGSTKKRMDKALDAFVKRGKNKKGGWRPMVAPIATGIKGRQERYKEARRDLEARVNNWESMVKTVHTNIEALVEAAPLTHAAMTRRAMAALAHLYRTMPKAAPRLAALGGEKLPRDKEISRWLRIVRAIENPSSVIDDLATGTVNRDAIEAVKTVYPEYWQQMREAAGLRVAELQERLPYQSRLQLSLALDIDLDPTLKPEVKQHLKMAAAVQMQEQGGGGQQGGGGGKKSGITVDERREPASARIERA